MISATWFGRSGFVNLRTSAYGTGQQPGRAAQSPAPIQRPAAGRQPGHLRGFGLSPPPTDMELVQRRRVRGAELGYGALNCVQLGLIYFLTYGFASYPMLPASDEGHAAR